jgi:hypothetical protein
MSDPKPKIITDEEKEIAAAAMSAKLARQVPVPMIYDRASLNFTFTMTDPHSTDNMDHEGSLERNLALIKSGLPIDDDLFKTIEYIIHTGFHVDLAEFLPTLLTAIESPSLTDKDTQVAYCLASFRILEIGMRQGLEDCDETHDESFNRIESVVDKLEPRHPLLKSYTFWLWAVLDPTGIPGTLLESIRWCTDYLKEDNGIGRDLAYSEIAGFFLIDEDVEGHQTMSHFRLEDLTMQSVIDDKGWYGGWYEISFKQARRHGAGEIGVPPPFRVLPEHALTWPAFDMVHKGRNFLRFERKDGIDENEFKYEEKEWEDEEL